MNHADVFIHPSADCEAGANIGAGTKVWRFSHVMAGASIGRDCVIGQGCHVAAGATLGDGVRLQNGVSVYDGVQLADGVFCGPNVVFTNVRRPRSDYPQKPNFEGIVVGRGVTIGANATVVCGVELGDYCFVGAGAVVSGDVPAFALCRGVPARQVGWVSRRGEPLSFDVQGVAVCADTRERYQLFASAGEVGVRLVL